MNIDGSVIEGHYVYLRVLIEGNKTAAYQSQLEENTSHISS
jgi:hypothetical protein